LRALDDLHVPFQDLARDRRVHVARGLHRLDDAERSVLADPRAFLRELDEDHVPKLLLGECRDADGGGLAVHAHPLVLLRIAQIVGDAAHLRTPLIRGSLRNAPYGRATTWPSYRR